MIGVLLGVPGKLSTLLARLTAARGANLDNADVTVSSRAPASTALSTGIWTQAHADAILAGGGSLTRALAYATPGAFTFNVPANVSLVYVTLQAAGGAGSKTGGQAGGGGAGELIRRRPYKVTPGGTVAGSVGAGIIGTGQNSTFGTLTANGGVGPTTGVGGKGGGISILSGAQTTGAGNRGSFILDVMGGGSGGAGQTGPYKGADCMQFTGGAPSSTTCGGGAASYYANGGDANATTTPTKPGIGAGSGATITGAARAAGGDGYALIEWIG